MSIVEERNQVIPRWDIPASWQWVSLADVGQIITGNTPSTKDKANYGSHIPFVKPPELNDKGISSAADGLSKKGTEGARQLPAGAVLVSCIGGLGKTGIARVPVTFNQQINAIVFDERVVPEFGFYYAQTLKEWLYSVSSATTLPIVNKSKFQQAAFPLAPIEDQRRIVAEIEKQFSRLDEAVTGLKRVKANLKRYKAAVLKAAVEGRLVETEAELARREGRSYETGGQLLKRILEERQRQWKGKGKYKEPATPDTTGLPELPEGWAWATLDQIGQEGRPVIYGIIKPGPHVSNGVPYVRVTEMKDGIIDVASLKRAASERAAKFARATLAAGDVLISKDGTIGRVAVVPPQLAGGNITQHVMRAPVHELMCRDHVVWSIRSDICQRWLTGETKGVALRGVNVEDFRRLPIPVAPLQEQGRIVTEVERRLSIINEVAAEVDTNLTRCERMRQAVLSKAFSGQLISSVSF